MIWKWMTFDNESSCLCSFEGISISFFGEMRANRTFRGFLSSSFAPSMRFLTVILSLIFKKKSVR